MSEVQVATSPIFNERGLSEIAILAQVRFLEGDVLTIADATYVNETQNKAVKDLLKQAFRNKMQWITELCRNDCA